MAIWIKRSQLIGNASEIIGYKSGLGLNREEFDEIIPRDFHQLCFGDNDQVLRIRSEEYENLISQLLYKVGNIPSPSNTPSPIILFKKYRNDTELFNIYKDLATSFIAFLKIGRPQTKQQKIIDPESYIKDAKEKYGNRSVNGY